MDGNLSEGIQFYQKFPVEPTINPDAMIAVNLNAQGKIDPADILKPINLIKLMDRLLTVQGDKILISCHGSQEGLGIHITDAKTTPTADQSTLFLFNQVGNAKVKIEAILTMPATTDDEKQQQADAFVRMLKDLKDIDGVQLATPQPGESASTYQALFNQTLDALAKKNNLSRTDLDSVLDKRQKLRGKFARIEVRACNIGLNKRYLGIFREFFGTKQVVAPKAVQFNATYNVDITPGFSPAGFASKTQAAIQGHQPVRENAQSGQVSLTSADIPPTRSFDVDTAPGDDVYLRQWLVQVHPHVFSGWLVARDQKFVREFLQQKVATDTTRYKDGEPVVVEGMWLIADDNTPFQGPPNTSGDPLAPATLPLPPFALPLDKEYRTFLVCDPP
jgi:hypothetical protein